MKPNKSICPILLTALSTFLVVSISGCDSRSWYEGFRTQQRQQCYGLPPEEYRACMEQTGMSYDNYQRQREETLQNK